METFDQAVFTSPDVDWKLTGGSISGGIPVEGAPKLMLTSGGGFWTCRMGNIWLRTPDQLKAARALEGRMDFGATEIIVEDRDTHLGPGVSNIAVDISMADPAAMRATEINVAVTVGYPLVGGEHFGIDHATAGRRMYRVVDVAALTAGEQTIKIRPPLREAVTTEDLDFNKPSCTMKMVNASEFFEAIRLGRFSNLNPVFVEASY